MMHSNDIKRRLLVLPWAAVLLLGMVGSASAQPDQRQIQLFANNCLQCHAAPHIGAPQLGNQEDWQDIIEQGEETILKHVVEGIRGMPPLGYCSACDEQDLRQLIYLITGMPEPKQSSGESL